MVALCFPARSRLFSCQPYTKASDVAQTTPCVDFRYRDERCLINAGLSAVLLQPFEGLAVGVYRESDELLRLVLRAPDAQRLDAASIRNLQIWSPAANNTIPFRQVVAGFETVFEDEIIQRINRERMITALADPRHGEAPTILNAVRAAVEALELPESYRLEWWGEYKSSRLRPVSMAAATTIPGMAPLFPEAFFVSMAATIAFCLGFATVLTMAVPVLYATIFKIKAG